ncbi:DUF305 domain-containing protein [Pseudarthrobacter sp. NPDC058329]|uniref:DUF305 domain-containing protein n=1 Tax=Pseudarthrobacter sp. NPDC058329 TaxID=3346448 RepID=UPI0036D9D69D
MKISSFAVAAALAASFGLTGCASGSDTSGTSTHGPNHVSPSAMSSMMPDAAADHNQADIMFAQMMIPHHAQAVEMGDIILAKPDIPAEATALATRIKGAQAPEIATMSGWLTSWKVPIMPDHSGHGMSGMVDTEGIDKLNAAQGAEAAKLFMEQMIRHHEGAIDMARQEIGAGKHADAVQLARDIVTAQEAEIAEMNHLLTGF